MEFLRQIAEKNKKRKVARNEKNRLQHHELLVQYPEFPHVEGCQKYNGLTKVYDYFVDPFNYTSSASFNGNAKCLDCNVSAKIGG